MVYSEKFKSRMVAKLVGPHAVSASILAGEVGISQPTLSRWVREARTVSGMAKKMGRKELFEISTLVTPDTLLRWYRRLIAKKYDGSQARRAGRPKTAAEIERLILRMARDNPRWGYTRIRGALRNLGHEIGRNTIKRILLENGFDPAPLRKKGMSWETFLKAHWSAIAATDFFSVEVLTRTGLVRYFVLFIIDLQTRRVEIAGIAQQPDGVVSQNWSVADLTLLRGSSGSVVRRVFDAARGDHDLGGREKPR